MQAQHDLTEQAQHKSLGVRLGIVSPDYPTLGAFRRGGLLVGLYTSVVALFVIAFLGLSFLVKENDTLRFDLTVGHWIQGTNLPSFLHVITQSGIYSQVLTHVTDLGSTPWSYVSYVVVLVVLVGLGLRLEGVVAVAGSALAAGLGMIVRTWMDRARPSPAFLHVVHHISGAGFPSGHVMMFVTLFGFVFYVVFIAWRWNVLKVVTLTVLALLVILIGMSRVYLGAHWPTDTTGAYLLGWLIVAGMIEVHRFLLHRIGAFRIPALPSISRRSRQTA